MPDIDCIREAIAAYPEVKVGFTIYRLTYADDASWARYMEHLNTRVRLNLEEQGDGDVFPHIDWDIQEDPDLQDADEETVRERFNSYVAHHPDRRFGGPRFEACVAVAHDDVNAVLDGPRPEVLSVDDTGCITLISLREEDGTQGVAYPLLFPRVYSLIDGLGWDHIYDLDGDIFAQ
ncbi:hypothetical protein OPT61_g7196 [Boeremia exigua]|uniref:Uncharacterized protein n=1 Tax=Boeremia exigua TaxID=749465 RepID=A0ACC2I3P7_9PLEO|nr:hypothetical protein OPT61_g7196 [Boeremia exigua]